VNWDEMDGDRPRLPANGNAIGFRASYEHYLKFLVFFSKPLINQRRRRGTLAVRDR